MNLLDKKIGIIGGGQLGKMMILDAKRLGFEVITLDPTEECPSHSISNEHLIESFTSEDGYRKLAEKVDVITYEFEHINADFLDVLEKEGHKVYPTASSLKIIQNKYTQKSKLRENGIHMSDFMAVDNVDQIIEAGRIYGYPMMLKTCLGGYDGKGNAVIRKEEDAMKAFHELGQGKVPLMAEAFVDFEKEISVLACRGIDGEIVVYPVAENIHKDSILDETIVPAKIDKNSQTKAMTMAHKVMEVLQGVGMFCTEMFVDYEGDIYLNEVAPRPHNSGHYTIEGTLTSQYEQHIRAITGLPFGSVELRSPIVMRNLLGEGDIGKTVVEGLEEAYKMPNVKVHIYGKKISKNKRKMGHLVALGHDVEVARKDANTAFNHLRIYGGK